MARRSILDEQQDVTEINLSSMIDCIFILLIFFIVTTVFVEEKGLQVRKPDAAASFSLEETQNVVVEITAAGKILVDGDEISLAELSSLIGESLRDGDIPVVIRAHEHASHGTFVSVWDAVSRAGAATLSFNTVE